MAVASRTDRSSATASSIRATRSHASATHIRPSTRTSPGGNDRASFVEGVDRDRIRRGGRVATQALEAREGREVSFGTRLEPRDSIGCAPRPHASRSRGHGRAIVGQCMGKGAFVFVGRRESKQRLGQPLGILGTRIRGSAVWQRACHGDRDREKARPHRPHRARNRPTGERCCLSARLRDLNALTPGIVSRLVRVLSWRVPVGLREGRQNGYHATRMNLRAAGLPMPLFAPFAIAVAIGGCRGCHDDHPYVPYTIGSATPRPVVDEDAAVAPSASAGRATPDAGSGDPFAGEPASVAPAGVAQWTLDGLALAAPEGRIFVLAVVRDFDEDGVSDAFAIVRPADGNDPGQAVFYHGAAAGALGAPVPFDPPANLARDAGCTPIDRLEVLGNHSVLVELGAQCPMRPSSAPVRWVAVVSGGATPKVRLAATLADPPGSPALSVDADASDRDADGRDDVALRVTIEGGGAPLEPGPRVSATFAWLDRPAGLSRDSSVTESSFAQLVASAASRSARVKDAPLVPGYVRQVRALWRATCAEGGAPRVVGVAGTGAIGCGTARALESAGLAEVRAYVTLGDPLRAALALERAERAPASHTPSRATEAQGWIVQLAPVSIARSVRAVAAVPLAGHGHEPSWGALAFENAKLLVRTAAGLVRVDPDQGDESAAGDGADWKAGVTSPDGSLRWIETYDPCDGLPLRASFATGGGDDMRDVALPVPAPLGGRCSGSRGAPAHATPIAWGKAGLEAIVEGEPILVAPDLAGASPLASFLDEPTMRGAPRSPNGKAYVVPTEAGLLVHGVRSRLFRARALDGTYGEQRSCVISDDEAHVACIHINRAWVGVWDPP
jgi:hypothetical protein